MNIAIILAGGVGARFGEEIPKQFLQLAGKSVIEHSIYAFDIHPQIDEIAIVCNPHYLKDVQKIIVSGNFTKVKKIIPGGKERYLSSLAAINAYEHDTDNLIFHDAVRPLVSQRIISDCIAALDQYEAIDVAIPSSDTIIEVDSNNCIQKIPDRKKLRNGQTPQCFKRGIIKQAYENALADPDFRTTDDCGVVVKYMPDIPTFVVLGDVANMKITYKEDLLLLNSLCKQQE